MTAESIAVITAQTAWFKELHENTRSELLRGKDGFLVKNGIFPVREDPSSYSAVNGTLHLTLSL